jgi:hypothetical protein
LQLTEIYASGRAFFEDKEFGKLLEYVETGFVAANDRRVLDRFTFRQRCIDADKADTTTRVLGVELATPVIMSSMTMPIPAIADDGLKQVAEGLKKAGSLMWTGTPIPANLQELVATGVPVAANVKPLRDRAKMHAEIERILAAGVAWLGLEVDAAVGTKIADREMGFECEPLSTAEIQKIKKKHGHPSDLQRRAQSRRCPQVCRCRSGCHRGFEPRRTYPRLPASSVAGDGGNRPFPRGPVAGIRRRRFSSRQ